mmetsp:Transcript_30094/g.90109  ORF Transcript_30094/g.90109 Transcript_30094/m.90109 type:complete len:235 (+) Transcript_30094:52-756(+)
MLGGPAVTVAVVLLAVPVAITASGEARLFISDTRHCGDIGRTFNLSECERVPQTSVGFLAIGSDVSFRVDHCVAHTGFTDFNVSFFADVSCAVPLFSSMVKSGICQPFTAILGNSRMLSFAARVDLENATDPNDLRCAIGNAVTSGPVAPRNSEPPLDKLSAGDDIGLAVGGLVVVGMAIIIGMYVVHFNVKSKELDSLHEQLRVSDAEEQQMQLMFSTDEPESPQDVLRHQTY